MDIDSFVKKVFELKPTYESLEHLAISDSLKHEIINSYIINKNPKVNIKSYSNRITSYNVCYTKLLRRKVALFPGIRGKPDFFFRQIPDNNDNQYLFLQTGQILLP